MNLPWWAYSPSPYTIVLYGTLGLIGLRGLKNVQYKHWIIKYVQSCTWLMFTVLLSDAVWCVFSLARFGWVYPKDVTLIILCIIRDLAAASYCYTATQKLRDNVDYRRTRLLWIVNLCFMVVWFSQSSSPAFTDWTYAIRFDYPWGVVAGTFFMSHVLGRIITAGIYLKSFK